MSNIFNNTEIANIIKIINALKNPNAIAKANANPIDFFAVYGVFLPKDTEYQIHLNDNQNFYFVILSPIDAMISDEQMRTIVAAKMPLSSVSSATCLSSASSFSCPGSSVGSFTTASSLSTMDIPQEQMDDRTNLDLLEKYQKNSNNKVPIFNG